MGSQIEGFNAIVIAIDKDKNSQHAVKWTVDNIVMSHNVVILVHVRTRSLQTQESNHPTQKKGCPPSEDEMRQFFLPYRGFCARKGIRAKEVVLHDIEIQNALLEYITDNNIGTIALGASSHNALMRKFRQPDIPTTISKAAPEFCSVYVISKDKVHSSRLAANRLASRARTSTSSSRSSMDSPPTSGILVTSRCNGSKSSVAALPGLLGASSTTRLHHLLGQSSNPSNNTESEDSRYFSSRDSWRSTDSSSDQRISFDKNMSGEDMSNNSFMTANTYSDSPDLQKRVGQNLGPISFSSDKSGYSSVTASFHSAQRSGDYVDQSVVSRNSQSTQSYQSSHSRQNGVHLGQQDLEAEVTRLRLQLKQTVELYRSYKSNEELNWGKKTASASPEIENQMYKEASEISERLAEMDTGKRKIAEQRPCYRLEEKEKKRATDVALSSFNNNSNKKVVTYQKYTLEEIEIATDYFSSSTKIGEGGYGPVYKAMLNHTPVAIKVLRPDVSHGLKQFQQEIEVLISMRHPNMVLLLGACPEYGCLVYEYMENGSLEDRLFCKGKTPPLPWQTRFKIAYDIATALLFLHQAKPEPLVHRDLKPANILLDHSYGAKISDVGLARLLPSAPQSGHNNNMTTTQYHITTAAGTLCYIDPEYQQTGLLTVKSDIYSLGVMFLQIITARPAMGLTHTVQTTMENIETFSQVLDPAIDDWPLEAAKSFAQMSLKCCELRKKDRPDLATVILPELIRLRDHALQMSA